jgi:nicotinamidase-related amidase
MHAPKTLLQMAGAGAAPTPLAESIVVVIDAQCEYVSGKVPLNGAEAALEAIARLLELARGAGAPVIHVVHRGRAGGLFDPLGKTFQIHPKAAPAAGEKIIEKELPNAFAKTALHLALQATGRKSLVLAGFMTHMCVSSTARAALDHGWRTTIIADACATRDLPCALGGEAIPAPAVHRAALAELADRFATVLRVADLEN